MARCSKKITGSLPRSAVRSRPTASSALDGTATCQPGACTNCTSLVWLCQGSPHLKKPTGMRTHHRRGEAVVGAPAHRAAIVDLLGRRVGVFAELDFRHRHQPGERHADGAADDAFLARGWCRTRARRRTSPAGRASRAWTPPLGPTSSPNTQHARIDRELVIERAADRGDHVDALAFGLRRRRSRAAAR